MRAEPEGRLCKEETIYGIYKRNWRKKNDNQGW